MKIKDYCVSSEEEAKKILPIIMELKDPLIIDIRSNRSNLFKKLYKGDYMWLSELSNKGVTDIFLRSQVAGTMKLRRVLDKIKTFERELIILYDNFKHLKFVKRIIHEQRGST